MRFWLTPDRAYHWSGRDAHPDKNPSKPDAATELRHLKDSQRELAAALALPLDQGTEAVPCY